MLGDRNHFEIAFLQAALQGGARSQRGNLCARDFILHLQVRHFGLEGFLAIAEMIKLESEIDVAQTGEREKSGQDNPARQRCGVDFIPIFSRPAHRIFSATRSFALRERGLMRRSFSLGSIGFPVTARRL